jgi:hypothetical protein
MLASTTITVRLQALHDAALTAFDGAQRMALIERLHALSQAQRQDR